MSDQMIHTRREFMHKGLTLISTAATVPCFLDRTAWAIADPLGIAQGGYTLRTEGDRILVVLQLAGGNDGLNTVIPYEDDLYYEARPKIAIAKKDVLKINDELGFHPRAQGLKQLYDAGLLAVVQGVGYPNPNRSHFIATDIWATADPKQRTYNGWIGRYFDCTCSGTARPDPKSGIALTTEAPLAMMGDRFSPVSFNKPEDLTFTGPGAKGGGRKAFDRLNTLRPSQRRRKDSQDEAGAIAFLKRTAMDAKATAKEIQSAARTRAGRRGGGGGSQLGRQLSMVRRMIAADLDTKVYYVSMGGFDTHAGQAGRHGGLMAQLGAALTQFFDELKEDRLLDRVVLMTFSEFGRRAAENASQGTDHGVAAPLFVAGSAIRPGIHGKHPSLDPEKLDQGDLKWNTDFRSIYTSILNDWLKADAKKILGAKFEKLGLFR